MKNSIKVVESFVSYQGEGPDTGKRCMILRFKKCNRRCSWCDTLGKIEDKEEFSLEFEKIQAVLNAEKCGLLITGGEPTYNSEHNNNLDQTLEILYTLNYRFANIETNGYGLIELLERTSIFKRSYVRYIYSPKVFNTTDFSTAIEIIKSLRYEVGTFVKVVCDPNSPFLLDLLKFISEQKIHDRVFLMPEGATAKELVSSAPKVLELANTFKFNFSSRSHIIYNFA